MTLCWNTLLCDKLCFVDIQLERETLSRRLVWVLAVQLNDWFLCYRNEKKKNENVISPAFSVEEASVPPYLANWDNWVVWQPRTPGLDNRWPPAIHPTQTNRPWTYLHAWIDPRTHRVFAICRIDWELVGRANKCWCDWPTWDQIHDGCFERMDCFSTAPPGCWSVPMEWTEPIFSREFAAKTCVLGWGRPHPEWCWGLRCSNGDWSCPIQWRPSYFWVAEVASWHPGRLFCEHSRFAGEDNGNEINRKFWSNGMWRDLHHYRLWAECILSWGNAIVALESTVLSIQSDCCSCKRGIAMS